MTAAAGSDSSSFAPGMDFLSSLMTGAAAKGTPFSPAGGAAAQWLMPTLDVEELDKRIQDLKTVQFWLEQNARILTSTIQALEVQRMTVATLKSMNVSMNDFIGKWPAGAAAAPETAAAAPAASKGVADADADADAQAAVDAGAGAHADPSLASAAAAGAAGAAAAAGVNDALQWWQQVTQQFGEVAAAVSTPKALAAGPAKAARKTRPKTAAAKTPKA